MIRRLLVVACGLALAAALGLATVNAWTYYREPELRIGRFGSVEAYVAQGSFTIYDLAAGSTTIRVLADVGVAQIISPLTAFAIICGFATLFRPNRRRPGRGFAVEPTLQERRGGNGHLPASAGGQPTDSRGGVWGEGL